MAIRFYLVPGLLPALNWDVTSSSYTWILMEFNIASKIQAAGDRNKVKSCAPLFMKTLPQIPVNISACISLTKIWSYGLA